MCDGRELGKIYQSSLLVAAFLLLSNFRWHNFEETADYRDSASAKELEKSFQSFSCSLFVALKL